MRGWQGDIILEVKLNGNGELIASKIVKGSGFDVLDNEGLDMVKRASPFPLPPEILKGKSFSILVPIRFKLE
jgi:protein TonB